MGSKWSSFALQAAIALLALSQPSIAQPPPPLKVSAVCQQGASGSTVCELRANQSTSFKRVTASAAGSVLRTDYEAFKPDAQIAAWLFLIQQNANPRDSALAIEKLAMHGGKRTYAVATFTDDVEDRTKFGASQSEIGRIKDTQGLYKSSAKAYLYYSGYKGLERLRSISAERRALVMFADGSTDEEEWRQRFIDEAKRLDVVVYTIFMANRGGKGKPEALKKIADDLGGAYYEAMPCKRPCDSSLELPEQMLPGFLARSESGGTARLSGAIAPNAPIVFEVETSEGAVISSEPTTLRVSAITVASEPNATDRIIAQARTMWTRLVTWAEEEPIPAGASATVAFGALVTLLALSRRRRRARAADTAPPDNMGEIYHRYGTSDAPRAAGSATAVMSPHAGDTQIEPAPDDGTQPAPVYGWLQLLDAKSTRMPIGSTSVRIGRHSDNDIILENKTVHRQHAVIHVNHDGRFIVSDLGGTNGVIVNGERREQIELADGDLVEFGEVRMRFYSNSVATV